jgi:glycosyltransferase involved in cell wall biosynthesis
VRDGRNGFVVPERNAAALADALRRVIADAGLANRMGQAAREDVRAFDYRRMGQAFEDAVEHAVASTGKEGSRVSDGMTRTASNGSDEAGEV